MDIFHTGKEDTNDDHKFINERLLELAIPEEPSDGHVITLEECLELFFNNKIEVKRHLDLLERRGTLNSIRSRQSNDSTKAYASHVEIAELDASQPSSPMALEAQMSATPVSSITPIHQRHRAPSIIQESYVDEKRAMLGRSPSIAEEPRCRNGRVRKEVMMPAWQFFSLIPWYTNNVPSNDAQVAAHFSSSRPILGICLKRYSMLPNGNAVKRETHIDGTYISELLLFVWEQIGATLHVSGAEELFISPKLSCYSGGIPTFCLVSHELLSQNSDVDSNVLE